MTRCCKTAAREGNRQKVRVRVRVRLTLTLSLTLSLRVCCRGKMTQGTRGCLSKNVAQNVLQKNRRKMQREAETRIGRSTGAEVVSASRGQTAASLQTSAPHQLHLLVFHFDEASENRPTARTSLSISPSHACNFVCEVMVHGTFLFINEVINWFPLFLLHECLCSPLVPD